MSNLVANTYNPANLSKQELIESFVVRLKTFQKIYSEIEDINLSKSAQSVLIQGVRGMGKTTMLLRLAYQIEDNLPDKALPIVLNEEEYGIAALSDLWERLANYLADKYPDKFADLPKQMADLYNHTSDFERACAELLLGKMKIEQKRLVVLVDNIGDYLRKFNEKDQQRLREVLMTNPYIQFITTSTYSLEPNYDEDHAFYGFFKQFQLKSLQKEEALDLLRYLAEANQNEKVKNMVERKAYRVEILRRLSGGVIRTIVLLYEVFANSDTGSAFNDLTEITNKVTPLYKHRMDDLSPQQQKIIHAMANEWKAVFVKDIVEITRMDSKVVSAQMATLQRNDVIEKVEIPEFARTKNNLYRISERFFNIWYLMRFGKSNDQRVRWLVCFMEDFIGDDPELMYERIQDHLTAIQKGTMNEKGALYLSGAFSHLEKDVYRQHELITKTRDYLNVRDKSMAEELGESDLEKYEGLFDEEGNLDFKVAETFKPKNKNLATVIKIIVLLSQNKESEAVDILNEEIDIDNIKENKSSILLAGKGYYLRKIYNSDLLSTELKINITFILYLLILKKISLKLPSNIFFPYLINITELKHSLQKEFEGIDINKTNFNILIEKNENGFKNKVELIVGLNYFTGLYLFLGSLHYVKIYSYAKDNIWIDIKSFVEKNTKFLDANGVIEIDLFLIFLAFGHFNVINEVIEDRHEDENFKTLYYLTLYFLRKEKEYAIEFAQMPPEMYETIIDMVARVKRIAQEYGSPVVFED